METILPLSFTFPGHAVDAVHLRRTMSSSQSHQYPYYNQQHMAAFTPPYQTAPSPAPAPATTYSFGHIPHPQHPGHYQQYVLPEYQSLQHHQHHHQHHHQQQSVRLIPDIPHMQPQLPDIRPARNAIRKIMTSPTPKPDPVTPSSQHLLALPSTRNELDPSQSPDNNSAETEFSTEVDILMKAIQSKAESPPQTSSPPMTALPPFQRPQQPQPEPSVALEYNHFSRTCSVSSTNLMDDSSQVSSPSVESQFVSLLSPRRERKLRKYKCAMPHCGKSFAQKTHLDIHTRAHTGDKPFVCKEPSCGQRFSQMGNLRTHQRRHTGERPYSCDICHKRFAQRGNVRAHKITHEETKPFICLLDDCGKQFTQLGNLKSHQNKFHAQTLRHLTLKFSSLIDPDALSPRDRELWEYFATLYKNSNKGIKGRGKDRRIAVKDEVVEVDVGERRRVALEYLNNGSGSSGSSGSEGDVKLQRGASEGSSSSYTGGSVSEDDDHGVNNYHIDRYV